MKRTIFYPFLVLVMLVAVVGAACDINVNLTEPPPRPNDNPAPTATRVISGPGPVQPSATPLPPAPEGGLDYSLDPNYGEQSLSAGFSPDPFEISITSGGAVDASYLGNGCTGYATSAPDFRLRWSGTSSRLRIMFVATGGEDTTLIINSANAEWICNDDAGGLNPMVEFTNPTAGTYDIWVGSYSSGQYISGTLKVTELNITP